MSRLPPVLVRHVCGTLLRDRRPAYLVTDHGGRLLAQGGDLPTYGLEALEPGMVVWEHVPFLRGLAAAAGSGGVVPFVQVADGRYADIHLFGEAETEWIVLLDMTSEGSRQAAIQQVHNERQLRLQRNADRPRTAAGGEPRLSDLYRALDVVALQREPTGTFRILSDPPPWAVRAFPAIATGVPTSVPLRELSPFLEHFEFDAVEHWKRRGGGQLKSGPWQEVGESGGELHLEANALSIGDAALLVIERLDPAGAQAAVLLQKAREVRVDQLRMRRDMELKEILLHCIVHDLSGPAAAIQGCFDSLIQENLSPPMRHLVELGVREAERQMARISQILHEVGADQNDVDSGDDAGLAPNVEACTAEVVGAIGQAFAAKSVSLFLHSLLKRDRRVVGDKAHLERILFNLLENALRYTPAGAAVVVEVREEGDYIRVNVDDEGPGVAEDVVPLLFRRFTGSQRRPTGRRGSDSTSAASPWNAGAVRSAVSHDRVAGRASGSACRAMQPPRPADAAAIVGIHRTPFATHLTDRTTQPWRPRTSVDGAQAPPSAGGRRPRLSSGRARRQLAATPFQGCDGFPECSQGFALGW